ncbi:Type 1 phosphatases regulator ypi1 [Coemansia brasiliensis]|uniref:Type 1 phosphatases regulator n=1 Tax=Coemansia brasiliensis TaxID=2650707 RepID=A0A9W8I8E9_9FUNG|nr:Type 1 phosphatases regulator ypi1 [Coemansia brasiliensis]
MSRDSRGVTASPAPSAAGSQTVVVGQEQPAGILHLRGSSSSNSTHIQPAHSTAAPRPRVQWTSDTVDNEHMGKKKSKVCCIYHRQRRFDESDSSCDSASCDSDSDGPNDYERMRPRRRQ